MNRRYQVFVSGTYRDLVDERAAVIQAILGLRHLPAGMEMFPAANEDQWTLIKRVIDESDYYIVVVAGMYGSVNADGISYTELEYDYALKTDVPILGFVHRDPGKIASEKTEQTQEARDKLAAFRDKVQKKTVKFFTTAEGLRGLVAESLVQAIETHQREGWVRARYALSPETEAEIAKLEGRSPTVEETFTQTVASLAGADSSELPDSGDADEILIDEDDDSPGLIELWETAEAAMADAMQFRNLALVALATVFKNLRSVSGGTPMQTSAQRTIAVNQLVSQTREPSKDFAENARLMENAFQNLDAFVYELIEFSRDPGLPAATRDALKTQLDRLRVLPGQLAQRSGEYNQIRTGLRTLSKMSRPLKPIMATVDRGFRSLDAVDKMAKRWVEALGPEDEGGENP